ncbi:dirigent protein 1-like [Oryza brachyantha]|uniref:dirigent protein 1-like n=1 Tax=Oryza brachyantha TaxID=4533 RepID=UPI001AD98669|nr:dirigent protein 1-like [Oryza brachyantha]
MAAAANKPPPALLAVAAAAIACILLAADAASAAGHQYQLQRRRPVHLRMYMHDVISGPGQTAIRLIWGVGPPHASMPGRTFGDTVAVDDLVTEGPRIDSPAVGRAQGTYMLSSQREAVLVVAVTVALTAGPYNGSTFVVAGRDRVRDETRELAVVGGTGALREATGYVLWRTAKVWSEIHMALELDVHASLPPPPQEDGAAATEWLHGQMPANNPIATAGGDAIYPNKACCLDRLR